MIGHDDPRLTTYVVDEIDAETAAAIERELEASPSARGEVEEIRAAAALLTEALRREAVPALSAEQRAVITRAHGRPRQRFVPAWLAIAAALVAATVAVALWRSARTREERVADVPAPVATVPTATATPVPVAPAAAPSPAPLRAAPAAAKQTVVVRGVVTDPTGAALPGAMISVQSLITGATATTTSGPHGEFELRGQPPGRMLLTAEMPGFTAFRQEAAPSRSVDWQPVLGVASMTEQVTVTTEAPVVDVASTTRSVTIRDEFPARAARDSLANKTAGMSLPGTSPAPSGRDFGPVALAIPGTVSLPAEREFNTESYAYRADNDFIAVAQHPQSTFSVDVDTASYSNVRRYLNANALPPADAVRIEELVNYFPYDYAAPRSEPFAAHIELGPAPWQPEHRLMRIGLRARDIAEANRPPSNLVFLVDVSGSMNQPDKLPLVQQSLEMLVNRLDGRDRIALVVYAGAAGLVLPSTSGASKGVILDAIQRLRSGGSTNGAGGITLAYDTAAANFLRGGNNRVILATDGDFNVGITDQGSLTRLIQDRAKGGVFLSVLGYGTGNTKDSTMELLSQHGNGNYAYIDTPSEARKALVEQLMSTLVAVAKDVKLQVEFNPARVQSYRLLGYENRLLRPEEFDDDAKDAGEVGAGHTVTALYEIVPVGAASPAPSARPLRYQERPSLKAAARTEELGQLSVRYKEPRGDRSRLLRFPISDRSAELADTTTDFRFAAAVATFGMLLRDSPHAGEATFDTVLELAEGGVGADAGGYRAEFVGLVARAKALRGNASRDSEAPRR